MTIAWFSDKFSRGMNFIVQILAVRNVREFTNEWSMEKLWMYFCRRMSVGDKRSVCEADAGVRLVFGIYGLCKDCIKLFDSDSDHTDKRRAEGV